MDGKNDPFFSLGKWKKSQEKKTERKIQNTVKERMSKKK